MTQDRVKPEDCRNMAEVRHGVDRLDEEIVALLGERFRYMDAAARIKPSRELVRDEARKAEVIANVRRLSPGVQPNAGRARRSHRRALGVSTLSSFPPRAS